MNKANWLRREWDHDSRAAILNELSITLVHELHQPLSIIMSNAEMAQRSAGQGDLDAAQIGALMDDIIVANEYAAALLKRLRCKLNGDGMKPSVVKVNDLIASVLRLMRSNLAHRQVQVEFKQAEPCCAVLADRVALEQVLINLINNGCKAMDQLAPADRVLTITATLDGEWVVVQVADVGVGLPPDPSLMFAPFYTTSPQGLGIGLSIVTSIMASHDGYLQASAGQPKGAVFSMHLPAMEASRL